MDVNEELKILGKLKKKTIFFFFLGGWGVLRGQFGCERRIEVFVKIQKKYSGGGGGGRGEGSG